MPRLLLLVPSQTYRATDFLEAARTLAVDVIVASDHRQAWEPAAGTGPVRALLADFRDPTAAAASLVTALRDASARGEPPVDGVLAVDDAGVVTASLVALQLGLAGHPTSAAAATRDKTAMRTALASAEVTQPAFAPVAPGSDGRKEAATIGFPVVVKPVNLAASRGVIRCDRGEDLDTVIARVRAIAGDQCPLVVERFVPGFEVALEGIVRGGELEILAVFDKPDPLDGPYFAETIYVTPSRLDPPVLTRLASAAHAATAAIGLRDGPVHAEFRVDAAGQPVVLEVAARTIGGLCSRTLQFGLGVSLEALAIRHALGRSLGNIEPVAPAAGVLMLPVPRAGTLVAVRGVEEAASVPGIAGVEITTVPGTPVEPLPEGDRYLGFVFARGPDPATVEAALRAAWSAVTVEID